MVGPTKLWSCTEARNEISGGMPVTRMPAELDRYIHIDKRVLEMLEEFERDTGKELNILVDKTGMSLILNEG